MPGSVPVEDRFVDGVGSVLQYIGKDKCLLPRSQPM